MPYSTRIEGGWRLADGQVVTDEEVAGLTNERQREVARLVLNGATPPEVARALDMYTSNVSTAIGVVGRRLGVPLTARAAIFEKNRRDKPDFTAITRCRDCGLLEPHVCVYPVEYFAGQRREAPVS